MKAFGKLLTIIILFSLLASCGGKPVATQVPAVTQPPATEPTLSAAEQWAKDNGVGPY